jgi:hypothetical protein
MRWVSVPLLLLGYLACDLDPRGSANYFDADAGGDVGACDEGFTRCGASCVFTMSDVGNCGSCGHVCGSAHAVVRCNDSKCAFACEPDYANCDRDDANGCEAFLLGDSRNCGACGRDCAGAACTNGACAPIAIASGRKRPIAIAVDKSHLFWTEFGASYTNGQLIRARHDGAELTPLIADLLFSAQRVVLDDSFAYVVEQGTPTAYADGSITRIGKDGACPAQPCFPTRLTSLVSLPTSIVESAGSLYVARYGARSVIRLPSNGGQVSTVASSATILPFDVTADPQGLVFTDQGTSPSFLDGTISTAAADGGVTPLVTGQDQPFAIVADAQAVYWTSPRAKQVLRAPRAGGAATVVARDVPFAHYLAQDANNLYVVARGTSPTFLDGAILAVGKDGTCPGSKQCPRVLASGQHGAGGIAVDDRFVYWTNDLGGTVMKVPK